MNIEVQYRDNNIEAIMSNEYKLLAVSMEGLSLLTSLVDNDKEATILDIDNKRKKIFIRECIRKIASELLKVNKE